MVFTINLRKPFGEFGGIAYLNMELTCKEKENIKLVWGVNYGIQYTILSTIFFPDWYGTKRIVKPSN